MVEYEIVRCCSCSVFQVQQKKKVKKYTCKLCGKKQTIQKIYGQSYKAADLRPIVQEYNMNEGSRKEKEEELKRNRANLQESDDEDIESILSSNITNKKEKIEQGLKNSVWNEYKYEDSESDEEENHDDDSVTLNFNAYDQLSGAKRRKTSDGPKRTWKRRKVSSDSYSKTPKTKEITQTKPINSNSKSYSVPASQSHKTKDIVLPQTKKAEVTLTSNDKPNKFEKAPVNKHQAIKKVTTQPVNSIWNKYQYDNSSEEESSE